MSSRKYSGHGMKMELSSSMDSKVSTVASLKFSMTMIFAVPRPTRPRRTRKTGRVHFDISGDVFLPPTYRDLDLDIKFKFARTQIQHSTPDKGHLRKLFFPSEREMRASEFFKAAHSARKRKIQFSVQLPKNPSNQESEPTEQLGFDRKGASWQL